MQFWDSLSGCVKCQVVSADLISTINKIATNHDIDQLEIVNDITATFRTKRTTVPDIEGIEIISRMGLYWSYVRIFQRPVLLLGIMVLTFLVLFLPTRVLFIEVCGNSNTTDYEILEAASDCGVVFGASRDYVRSEKMKNTLLQKIPMLQWACVNTRGCVAEITVQERVDGAISSDEHPGNIVARTDGIITDITVYKGTALCRLGQVVRKGQVLVSGYSDLGLLVKEEAAAAEVRAETLRSVSVIALSKYAQRERCLREVRRYSIIVGKKQINFYKGSGILPPECGRINKIYTLTLPGGFSLPISVVREEIAYYDTNECADIENDALMWLSEHAEESVLSSMIAGEIIKKSTSIMNDGSVCHLHALYRCREMIGIKQAEELYTNNG